MFSQRSESEDSTDLDGFIVSDDVPLSTARSSCDDGSDRQSRRELKNRKRRRFLVESSDEEVAELSQGREARHRMSQRALSHPGRVECASPNKRAGCCGVEETSRLLEQARTLLDVARALVDHAAVVASRSHSANCGS